MNFSIFHKTIHHRLASGKTGKFTARDRIIDGETFYYANVIDVEDTQYKKLTVPEKEVYYGMEITNGKRQAINYRSSERLINDILTKYGNEWLQTEK